MYTYWIICIPIHLSYARCHVYIHMNNSTNAYTFAAGLLRGEALLTQRADVWMELYNFWDQIIRHSKLQLRSICNWCFSCNWLLDDKKIRVFQKSLENLKNFPYFAGYKIAPLEKRLELSNILSEKLSEYFLRKLDSLHVFSNEFITEMCNRFSVHKEKISFFPTRG